MYVTYSFHCRPDQMSHNAQLHMPEHEVSSPHCAVQCTSNVPPPFYHLSCRIEADQSTLISTFGLFQRFMIKYTFNTKEYLEHRFFIEGNGDRVKPIFVVPECWAVTSCPHLSLEKREISSLKKKEISFERYDEIGKVGCAGLTQSSLV